MTDVELVKMKTEQEVLFDRLEELCDSIITLYGVDEDELFELLDVAVKITLNEVTIASYDNIKRKEK